MSPAPDPVGTKPDDVPPRRIPVDNALRGHAGDRLGRVGTARELGDFLVDLNASEGVTVGLFGPWGSGKTSIARMALREVGGSRALVVEVAPAGMVGPAAAAEAFYAAIGSSLRINGSEFRDLAGAFERLGRVATAMSFLPAVGPLLGAAGITTTEVAARAARRVKRTKAEKKRASIAKKLERLGKPLLVLVDDIDRLPDEGIAATLLFLRSAAGIPGVIYLLPLDRQRVKRAMKHSYGDPAYAEKFLQVVVDVPEPDAGMFRELAATELSAALEENDASPEANQERLSGVFLDVVLPALRTPRDVMRLASSLRWAVRSAGALIASEDLLALETLRLFVPEAHAKLGGNVGALTGAVGGRPVVFADDKRMKDELARLRASAEGREQVFDGMLQHIFPFAASKMGLTSYGAPAKGAGVRLLHASDSRVLEAYLRHSSLGAFRNIADARELASLIGDVPAFVAALRDVDEERRQDVIHELPALTEELKPDRVPAAIVGVLASLELLPKRRGGIFDSSPEPAIMRVVANFLAVEGAIANFDQIAADVLAADIPLATKILFASVTAPKESSDRVRATEAQSEAFATALAQQIRSTDLVEWRRARGLIQVCLFLRDRAEEEHADWAPPNGPDFTLPLIVSAGGFASVEGGGSRFVQHPFRISWSALERVYGSKDATKSAVNALLASGSEIEAELRMHLERYVADDPRELDPFGGD